MIFLDDVRAKSSLMYGNINILSLIRTFFQKGTLAVGVYRFGQLAKKPSLKFISPFIKLVYYPLFYIIQMFTGISIQAYANIGKNFVVMNHSGIFVVAEIIGDNVVISEGVTIGNTPGAKQLSRIGNNVIVEPGAKILGDLSIGDNVLIRSNSLVLQSIPEDSMAIGHPARRKPLPDNWSLMTQYQYYVSKS